MNNIMDLLYEMLKSDGFVIGTKILARAIGLNESILYSALLTKESYYATREQLDEEGMFYSTADDLEESTTLTRRQQAAAIENLVKMNLITTKLKGTPPKKHFKINKDMNVMEELLIRGKIKASEKTKRKSSKREEGESERDFDTLSKSNLTECQNQIQQNVENDFNEMSKSCATKGENQIVQNVKQNLYNKTYIKKIISIKHKHNARSYPQTYPQAHERIIKAWNSIGLSQIKAIEGNGETMLNALIEQYGEDQVVKAVESIKESELLCGRRPSGFVIQFGWFLKPAIVSFTAFHYLYFQIYFTQAPIFSIWFFFFPNRQCRFPTFQTRL